MRHSKKIGMALLMPLLAMVPCGAVVQQTQATWAIEVVHLAAQEVLYSVVLALLAVGLTLVKDLAF